MKTTSEKCLHATCTCDAAPASAFCCEECKMAHERERAGETPDTECRCKHANCGGQPEAEIAATSMLIASSVLAEA